tara:strand:+ start:2389 stop:3141 length:753 start_codon:yes stop_codon:yes gene_type:complete
MLKSFKKNLKISIRLFIRNPLSIFTEWYNFYKEYSLFKKETTSNGEDFNLKVFPCLFDKKDDSLNIQYYDYQNGWAIEQILKDKPINLVDIGSNIAFLVFASKLTKVTTIDIRQHNIPIDNLVTKIGDILNIPYDNDSVEYLSSLSVIEHIGLGRYGDDIDFQGMQKSINEFYRVLKDNGTLLVSFPIGSKNDIEFNAHRRFSPEKIYEMFGKFKIQDEIYILKNKIIDFKSFNEIGMPNAFVCFKFIKN